MTEPLPIIMSFLAGAVLAGLYLLGLWWTVRRVAATGRRSLLLLSFTVRAALLLAALYGIMQAGPWSLIAALVGFLLPRSAVTSLAGGRRDDPVT